LRECRRKTKQGYGDESSCSRSVIHEVEDA
jgi:hypothetical protein